MQGKEVLPSKQTSESLVMLAIINKNWGDWLKKRDRLEIRGDIMMSGTQELGEKEWNKKKKKEAAYHSLITR